MRRDNSHAQAKDENATRRVCEWVLGRDRQEREREDRARTINAKAGNAPMALTWVLELAVAGRCYPTQRDGERQPDSGQPDSTSQSAPSCAAGP